MRRNTIAALVLLAVVGLAWLAYRESGRARVVAEPRTSDTRLTLPTGQPGAVAWIESAAGPTKGKGDTSARDAGSTPSKQQGDRVMLARRWRGPKQVASGDEITAVAVDGAQVLVASRQAGEDARLVAIDAGSGKRQDLATVQGRADKIAAADGVAAWIERREAAVPAAPFVAAAGPVTVIRSAPQNARQALQTAGGQVSVVAVPDTDPTAGSAARPELLGIAHNRVYWLEHRGREEGAVTVIMSADAGGGTPQTAVAEQGWQEAVLLADSVVWTCASPESAASNTSRAVKRMTLAGGKPSTRPAGKPEVIADWLGRDMQLLGSGAGAYVQDKEVLWRLGDRRGEQRVLYTRPGAVTGAVVIGDDEYIMLWERKQSVLAERPLTWWARVRHLLRG